MAYPELQSSRAFYDLIAKELWACRLSAADKDGAIFAGWLGPGRVGLIAGWPMSDGLGGVVDYYTS